jgi:hypothetical protein
MPLQWCQPSDLTAYGINAQAIQDVPISEQVKACIAATGVMAGYFRARFPVDDPGFALLDTNPVMYTAWIAAFIVLSSRGYDPAGDPLIKERYDAAITYGESVQRQAITPLVSNPPQPGVNYQAPAVITHCRRGW